MAKANPTLFGPEDMIDTYTDREAVADGLIVGIGGANRVTRPVWEWLVEALPEREPPVEWPVELMGWFRGPTPKDRAFAAARGIVDTYGQRAREVYERNIEGGIFVAHAALGEDGRIVRLYVNGARVAEATKARKLWLIPNEVGGITLLFPEDY